MYKLILTNSANKDFKKLKKSPYLNKAKKIFDSLQIDPYQESDHFEYLSGDMEGYISKRINIQHRIVYQIFEEQKIVRVLRAWTHYE